MAQWARARASRRSGSALSGGRLVMSQAVSTLSRPRLSRRRSSLAICARPDQSR